MFKNTAVAGIALASAFAVTGASAHETANHTYHGPTYTAPSYTTQSYTAPTINLGPIEQVQPQSTVQYVQPTTSYVQPATTTTYTAPVTSYVPSSATTTYTSPSYTAPSYTTPSYTTPSYAAQPTNTYGTTYTTPTYGTTYTAPSTVPQTYTAPSYGTVYSAPSYVAPSYVLPRYDATERVKNRMDRLRWRIRKAVERGDLRDGERHKLRRKMRKIRDHISAFRSNDGVIDSREFAELNDKMSRQSKRIRKLANNDHVVGSLASPYGSWVSPYGHRHPHF